MLLNANIFPFLSITTKGHVSLSEFDYFYGITSVKSRILSVLNQFIPVQGSRSLSQKLVAWPAEGCLVVAHKTQMLCERSG